MTYNVDFSLLKLIHLFFENMMEEIIKIVVKLNGKSMGGSNDLTAMWTNYIT